MKTRKLQNTKWNLFFIGFIHTCITMQTYPWREPKFYDCYNKKQQFLTSTNAFLAKTTSVKAGHSILSLSESPELTQTQMRCRIAIFSFYIISRVNASSLGLIWIQIYLTHIILCLFKYTPVLLNWRIYMCPSQNPLRSRSISKFWSYTVSHGNWHNRR